MTRKEYVDMLNSQGPRAEPVRSLSKKFERGPSTYLVSKIPSLNDSFVLNIRDILCKFSFVQFQNPQQRPGRPDNQQNREGQEKSLKYIG